MLPALSGCKNSVAEAFVGERKHSCALLIFGWTQICKDLYLASLCISSCQSSLACTMAAIFHLCVPQSIKKAKNTVSKQMLKLLILYHVLQ